MFELHLDISLVFEPPMKHGEPGIRLTRIFELPFAPVEGMYLTGDVLNDPPRAEGFKLQNITWDVDRCVFLADADLTCVNLPLGCIPDEIQSWLGRGWKLGSFEEYYLKREEDDLAVETELKPGFDAGTSQEEIELWPSLPPRKRPAAFNRFLRALVREMVENRNNLATAYAIDQTNLFFTDKELRGAVSCERKRFSEALQDYAQLGWDACYDWQERVREKYPRMKRSHVRNRDK